jgi:hypothetical protein
MGGRFYHVGTVSSLPSWHLWFAKEPEPDVDLELQETSTAQNQPAPFGTPASQKPPRLRILILIILLLIVAGGAYFAMDPELVMKLTGQEPPVPSPATPSVTAVRRPVVPPPSPSPRTVDPEALDSIIPAGALPAPSFGEGQRVSVVSNSASPGLPLSLSQDAAGTKPGPTVGAGGTLLVLDAELHDHTWVYLVRTDEGAKGWVAEKQLAARP